MNNKKYFYGERNNYFFGKLMTVRDFENEQRYHNNKRRLGNHMLHGAGIVSGMGVLLVDNQTISIEKGMAIDYLGREVIIPESIIKKISTLDGFEEYSQEKILYLCIEYSENLKETTFAVSKTSSNSDAGQEFNRITEGYRLFLTPNRPTEQVLNMKNLVSETISIIETAQLKISIEVPHYVNPGELVRVLVHMEKIDMPEPVKYSFKISGNMFKSTEGLSSIDAVFEETEITPYSSITNEYYMMCDALHDGSANIIVNSNNSMPAFENDINIPVKITSKNIRDMIVERYYSQHFDDIIDIKEEQKLYLAKLHIISNNVTYFIESLQKFPFEQFLLNSTLMNTISEMEYKRISVQNKKPVTEIPSVLNLAVPQLNTGVKMNTGVQRISLGFSPKAGKSFLSPDIIHGFGDVKVAVVLAMENQKNVLTDEDHVILFGDGDIFENGTLPSAMPKLRMGAILYPEKGIIKIGVKLLAATNLTSIDVRWWAYQTEDMNNTTETYSDSINVSINPPTAQISPMEQVRFSASISGMMNQEVNWRVDEQGGGTIDSNGLYTAPSREGVYAIIAQSVKYEQKKAIAYIVVKA